MYWLEFIDLSSEGLSNNFAMVMHVRLSITIESVISYFGYFGWFDLVDQQVVIPKLFGNEVS